MDRRSDATEALKILEPRSRHLARAHRKPRDLVALVMEQRAKKKAAEQAKLIAAPAIRADYADVLPSAFICFDDDFGACIAHLRLPVTHRRFARTTNLLERLFVEECGYRRSRPRIPIGSRPPISI